MVWMFFLWNARSIVNKLVSLQLFIYLRDFHIVALTETSCHSNISDSEILPKGYTLYRNDRDYGGGGVLIAVSDSIRSELMSSPPHSECLIVKVFTHRPITLCLVYAPPSPDNPYFFTLLKCIHPVADSSDVIILGDFNYININWASVAASTGPSKMLCDLAFSYDLCQVVDSPTHCPKSHCQFQLVSLSLLIRPFSYNLFS
uniref:Endonuclease/exonuclease/phosphatase domain-containing protein n=1 Tax=Amphimedon queenslandica TaxID=400682 RepID=A0A1X7U0A1_AMPQE